MAYGIRTEIVRRYAALRSLCEWILIRRNSPLRNRSFWADGKQYRYLVHPYNHTWKNERAVELPMLVSLLKTSPSSDILEIGNVLSHYFCTHHDIIDMHEISFRRRIIRKDILAYQPTRKYGLVLSVSTVEHIGWDDGSGRPERVLDFPSKVRGMLKPAGQAVISIPLGYNPVLDNALRTGELNVSRAVFLLRVSSDNLWEETDVATAFETKYGSPFPCGNAVAICSFSPL